ncbi:L-aspartate oxidase [Sneathiella marina]|uniref:L-aspartate oxidase n=1 Tax=Sneathiella marina TaxID=2950108 RepID=A0ABY4W411_9PROT|nr:L-aspartate oxidase [Sneathiella marina]USG61926.1 L-aspartate oxidase [Sneathiella marina]
MEQTFDAEVLVIGAGIAGLVTALSLTSKEVTLLCKGSLGSEASTAWAQGGIAAAMSSDDSPGDHCRDTLAVAGGIANETIAALVAKHGRDCIQTLIDLGVLFDHNDGQLSLRKEAAHSHRRVVHANGDSTGKEIMRALTLKVRQSPHITVLENSEAIDLLVSDGCVAGSAIYHEGQTHLLFAEATVLATGGIGQIYSATTNPLAATGDGLAIAARAGASLKDLEFVQFHPTALDVDAIPRPLATEALRGEGAHLVNETGERFMLSEHALAELAPRDILARGIWNQINQGHKCYLDTRQSLGHLFLEEFPTVFGHCKAHGIDPVKELIPVAPAVHYHMGGITTDKQGRTSLPGLWACGEVACTGLHGANRLASNSLLEAVVFAKRIVEDILKKGFNPHVTRNFNADDFHFPTESVGEAEAVLELQSLNYRHIGLCRDEGGLTTLICHLEGLERRYPSPSQRLKNIFLCSRLVATSALRRRESRGSHYRSDYPTSSPDYAVPTTMYIGECWSHPNPTGMPLAS